MERIIVNHSNAAIMQEDQPLLFESIIIIGQMKVLMIDVFSCPIILLHFPITPNVIDLILRSSYISHFGQQASLHTTSIIISLR